MHEQKLTGAKLVVGLRSDATDLRYATGFSAPDFAVYLRTKRARLLLVPALEYGRATREAKNVTVLSPADLCLSRAKKRKLAEWILALMKREGVRHVFVSWTFPLLLANQLERAGVRVTASKQPLFPEREKKCDLELSRIREAQQAAVIAMRATMRLLEKTEIDSQGYLRDRRHRLTSEHVRLLIEQTLMEHDCSGDETIVAGGTQAADPHERGHGPLRAGEMIVIDIFPQHKKHGYWGDLTRTVIKGAPSKEQMRLYRAVKAAQKAALTAIRPHVKVRTVHRRVQDVFEERRFSTGIVNGFPEGFIHGTGHGVGLNIHEAPSIHDGPGVLKEGQVITVEPGLYYRGIGGCRIEDTVRVTRDGWRYMYPCEKRFQI